MTAELHELTIVGDRGRQRIQLDPSTPLDVGDILAAAGPACTGIAPAAVDDAIDAGRLQLLADDTPLEVDAPAGAITASELFIRLIGAGSDRANGRVLRAAGPVTAPQPRAEPPAPAPRAPEHLSRAPEGPSQPVGVPEAPRAHSAPSPAPEARTETPSPPPVRPRGIDPDHEITHNPSARRRNERPAASHSDPSGSRTDFDGDPAPIELPTQNGALRRMGMAYRALRDSAPQSNGLPAPPASTRARHAWRRSDYLDTLKRGIAEPELTQCAVIAFLSSKGGVGKTTTAQLVAMALAEARRDRCVLIDANPDRGTLGTNFGRGHTIYVDDVRAVAEKPGVSPSELDAMLANGPHGLRVLPAPQDSSRRRKLGQNDYAAVIGFLRQHVGIIVIDLGIDMLAGPTIAALQAAEQLVVISNDAWIAGEQTAASFWDDVRAITDAEYTIVANDITGKHNAAAQRLRDQLVNAPGADSAPRGVSVVAHDQGGYTHLQDRAVEWADLPRQWQLSSRELTYRLAQDWPRLGLARAASYPLT